MKYREKYDLKIIDEYGDVYEEDHRLGENYYDIGESLDSINDESAIIDIIRPNIFNCNAGNKTNSTRKFKRNYRKHDNMILPYIKISKIYNGKVYTCRISMYEPKYITGYNENMRLTDDQIDILVSKLNSIRPQRMDMTLWETIIYLYNKDLKHNGIMYHIPETLKIPDYTQLVDTKKK